MTHSTIQELNLLSANQKAGKMLQEIGLIPDQHSLYSVQLALWAIENSLADVDESVAETTRAMLTWKPARLMNFLVDRSCEAQVAFDGCEASRTPQELACKILEIIENRMMIHFPWYFDVE